jgi:hypothetical protein
MLAIRSISPLLVVVVCATTASYIGPGGQKTCEDLQNTPIPYRLLSPANFIEHPVHGMRGPNSDPHNIACRVDDNWTDSDNKVHHSKYLTSVSSKAACPSRCCYLKSYYTYDASTFQNSVSLKSDPLCLELEQLRRIDYNNELCRRAKVAGDSIPSYPAWPVRSAKTSGGEVVTNYDECLAITTLDQPLGVLQACWGQDYSTNVGTCLYTMKALTLNDYSYYADMVQPACMKKFP